MTVRKGQSILIVLVLLSVMMVMGLSVSIVSVYEMRLSRAFMESQKARYAAEAGIAFSKELIKAKTGVIDTLDDPLFAQTRGSDIDVNGDGINESKTFAVVSPSNVVAGYFAIEARDEAGKLNLNAFETTYAGICDPSSAAGGLGFSVTGTLPRDLLVIEQALGALAPRTTARVGDLFTVYSAEPEMSLAGKRRKVLSRLPTPALVRLFLDSGVYYTKALTWADAMDDDVAASETYVHRAIIGVGGASGGGYASDGSYRHAQANTGPSTWTLALGELEPGQYFVYFFGKEGEAVGTIELTDSAGTLKEELFSGEGLSRPVTLAGKLAFSLTPPRNQEGYVRAVELVALSEHKGLAKRLARGVEAVRINEVYANPTMGVAVTDHDNPGGTWGWTGSAYRSPAPGQKGSWKFAVPRSGYYYVKVFAQAEGGYVGSVAVGNERIADAYHGSWTKRPVFVNKTVTVDVTNETLAAEATLAGIELSQEPDGEYVELVNVSDTAVDLGGCTLEAKRDGAGVLGWPARIPEGTVIAPLGYAVLAVDADDASCPAHLKGNNLSFQTIWGESAKQLQFANAVVGSDDIVPDSGVLILKDRSGQTIDAAEYDGHLVAAFQSLERGDPTADEDADSDGYSDRWYPSLAIEKATPGRSNKNSATQIIDPVTLEVTYHDIAQQQIRRPAEGSITAIAQLPSSFPWQKCSLRDAAFLADKVTQSEVKLDLAEGWIEGTFGRESNTFVSARADQVGRWRFNDLEPGAYSLAFVSDSFSEASVKVSLSTESGKVTMGPLAPQNGMLSVGAVDVGADGICEVEIRNVDGLPLVLTSGVLYPAPVARGKVNVNTADESVLSVFFGTRAAAVIAGRPYGERDTRRLGIGDLLMGSDAAQFAGDFSKSAKALCVRSNAYGVRVRGETDGNPKAKHEITTVIEK